MAEETEGQETGAAEASGAGVDPAAVALALGGASRERADAFLKDQQSLITKQGALVDDQRHHLREQFKQLRLNIWQQRMGVLLRVATALVGVAVAGFLGAAVWNAAQDDGLVIEAFSVPPDFTGRGLTGEVVASQLLANLSAFQAITVSARAASSYSNNWGDDIKVEIPETGVSIGEFNRFLHEWLGHQTHITGAVYRTATGIAVTVRVGNDMTPTVTGGDAELDQLLRETSEAIYRATQPFRYAQYVFITNRIAEGETLQKAIIANGSPQDRFWAYNGLVTMYSTQLDFEKSAKAAQGAIALRPSSSMTYYNFGRVELAAQHDEAALAASQAALRLKRDPDISEQSWATIQPWVECVAMGLQGDYKSAVERCQQEELLPDFANTHMQTRLLQMSAFAAIHDGASLRDAYANLPPTDDPRGLAARAAYETLNELVLGHWEALAGRRAELGNGSAMLPYSFFFNPRTVQPAVAYALALSGNFSDAHTEIDKTPADCSLCLRMHGRVDGLEKNWGGANYWFTRAARDAPSTPFPFTDWGQMLLDKGDTNGAIAKFTLASQKGPHFADPLEMWGEALMKKNRSDLAIAKFTEAEKYAPNWGHLHLKWGEALGYAGKKDEAQKQYAIAAGLDLSTADKAELAKVSHG